jgi:hypothetical protein
MISPTCTKLNLLKKRLQRETNLKKKLIIEIMIPSTCTELNLLIKRLQRETIFKKVDYLNNDIFIYIVGQTSFSVEPSVVICLVNPFVTQSEEPGRNQHM